MRDLLPIAGGGGVNMPWVYMLSAIYETVCGVMAFQRFGVVVLHRSMVNCRGEWSQSAMGICAFFYI